MKKTNIKILALSLCTAFIPSIAQANLECLGISTYLGMDAQVRNIKWQKNYGDNLFKKNYPQGNFFGGIRFLDYLGLEAGYEVTQTRTSENRIPGGSLIAGLEVEQVLSFPGGIPPILVVSKAQVKGWHGDIMGYIPVRICEPLNIELIGSVGLARLNIFHNFKVTADTFTVLNPLATFRSFKAKKTVLRLGLGIQQTFDDCYGLRILFNYETSSKFNLIPTLEDPLSVLRVAPKNSWSYGLGLFFKY